MERRDSLSETGFVFIRENEHARREANILSLHERPLAIESPPIAPPLIRVITGEEGIIHDTTDAFFKEVLDYLGVLPRARGIFTTIEDRYLAKIDSGTASETLFVMPEYWMQILKVTDIPIASAISYRDDSNYCLGLWASYIEGREEFFRKRLQAPDQDW